MGQATGIGARVNIGLNAVLIRSSGAFGAAVATMISYFTMYAVAFSKVRKHVELSSNRCRDFFVYLLLLIQMTVMVKEVTMDYLWSGLLFVVIFLIYGKEMLQMLKGFLGKRK